MQDIENRKKKAEELKDKIDNMTHTDAEVDLMCDWFLEACGEIERLRKGLEFYAKGEHLSCFDEWDTVSGEPQNWIVPDWEEPSASADRPEMVEMGAYAKAILEGKEPSHEAK